MDYPFRVQSFATARARAAAIVAHGDAGGAPPQSGADGLPQYLTRVMQLIPAEVVSLYQGVRGVMEQAKATDAVAANLLPWLPWAGLVLVIFVRAWGTRDSTGSWRSVQVGAVVVASVSFVIWVFALGEPMAGLSGIDRPWLGSVLLMMWPFLIPYFYRGA